MNSIRYTLWISGICLIVLTSVLSPAVQSADLETSLVLLNVQSGEVTIDSDEFFELLNLTDYVLVPLNYFQKYFNFTVSFDRENQTAVVTKTEETTTVHIDFKNQLYNVADQIMWVNQPPIMFESTLYVTPELFEFLFDVSVKWEPKYQELTVTGDCFSQKTASQGDPSAESLDKKSSEDNSDSVVTGPDYSLGSVKYKVLAEHRSNSYGTNLSADLIWDIHGRAGDWAVSVGGESDEAELSYFRAKYNENDKLIILGDSEVLFDEVFGEKKELRGLLYLNPDRQYFQLVAYTSLSGTAASGSKVYLYVNGKLRAMQQVTSAGSFTFESIPLQIKRVNELKVVTVTRGGEEQVTIKKVAASPRLLKEDSQELMVALGRFRDLDEVGWEGTLAGLRARKALSNAATISWEGLVREPDPALGEYFLGSDLGLAFRVGSNLVVALDWLVGGTFNEDGETAIGHGGESTLLYCLENGYVETMFFYRHPHVAKGVDREAGMGVEIVSVIEFTPKWDLETTAKLLRSFEPMTLYEKDELETVLTHKWGDKSKLKTSLTLEAAKTLSVKDDLEYETTETGVSIGQQIHGKTVGVAAELGGTTAQVRVEDGSSYKLCTGEASVEATETITKSLVASESLATNSVWRDGQYLSTDLEGEAQLKHWMGDTMVLGSAAFEGTDFALIGYELTQSELGVLAEHYFTPDTSALVEVSRNWSQPTDAYMRAEVGASHWFPNRGGKVSGGLWCVSPIGMRTDSQWAARLSYSRIFGSGLELTLEAERMYVTLWDDEPEDIIRLRLDQSLAFAPGLRRGQEYIGREAVSFVGGVVYLDENGNGSFDDGDTRLTGIRMNLDGRRAVSDESGEYAFDYVRPGLYQLGFDLRTLDANYTPVTPSVSFKIRENENMAFDFGLTMNGTVSGKVFFDKNANGVMDSGEEPLDWVGLSLDNNSQSCYTSKNGAFYFENVPLGEHELKVQLETLEKTMKLAGDGMYSVRITPDQLDVGGIVIAVGYKWVE